MASIYNICSVVTCFFAAFLIRFDKLIELVELVEIVRSNVKIKTDMLKLFIQSSQTDQFGDEAWIVVASSGKATCPVAAMNRYVERARLSCYSPLFWQLTNTRCGYKPRA